MKVTIFSTYYYPNIVGGGEISTQLLAEGLSRKGITVEVVTLGEKDEQYLVNKILVKKIGLKRRKEENKQWISVLKKIFYFFLDFFDISLYLKYKKEIEKTDILHITNFHYISGLPLLYILFKKKVCVIQSIRAPIFESYNNFLKKIIFGLGLFFYKIYSKNIIFHFPTEYMYKYVSKNSMRIRDYFIIGNTVLLENEMSLKSNYICFSGSIVEYKGVNTLISAFLKLEDKNLELLLIGKGKLVKNIKNEKIKITGWLSKEENYNLIKKSKILILPSEWPEAFGRVLIEAIKLGTIPIGSDSGAIPEVLDYDSRYIFKTKNINSLKEKIERILKLSENEYRKEIQDLQRKMEKYSYETHIENFIKQYKKCLEKSFNGEKK